MDDLTQLTDVMLSDDELTRFARLADIWLHHPDRMTLESLEELHALERRALQARHLLDDIENAVGDSHKQTEIDL